MYVCNEDDWRETPGWHPGRAAARYGAEEGFGHDLVAYHVASWPASITPGLWWVDEVLDAARASTLQHDTLLHEVAGHQVLGWGHDVVNTVMNAELRSQRGGTLEEDRRRLADALLHGLDAVRVHRGPPTPRPSP